MGLKSDTWIKEMSKKGMIEPFCEKQIGKNSVSFGLSSYGYDIRVGSEFMIFTNIGATLVDPKSFDERNVVEIDAKVKGFCFARCWIIVNVTPFEPEFEGHITIEISNTTPLPAKIYANEGIAQVLFLEGDEPCEVSYKDKKGKYQGQRGITLPKVMK